uniref:HDAC_interact domain-containing protein n=1 Tax=Parastrongyloides trichosuri TaxID=131310 RepID=A0A0N4ZU68_PARTI
MGNEDSENISMTVVNDKCEATIENTSIPDNISIDEIKEVQNNITDSDIYTSKEIKNPINENINESNEEFNEIESAINDESVTSNLPKNETEENNYKIGDTSDEMKSEEIEIEESHAHIFDKTDDISSNKITINQNLNVEIPYINEISSTVDFPYDSNSEINQDSHISSSKNESDLTLPEINMDTIVSCKLPCGLKVTLPSNLVPKDSIIFSTITSTEISTISSNGEIPCYPNGNIDLSCLKESKVDDSNESTENEEVTEEKNDIISCLSREISKAMYSGTQSIYTDETTNSSTKSITDLVGVSHTNYSNGLDNATTSFLDACSPDLTGSQSSNTAGSLSSSLLGNQINNFLGTLTNEFITNQLSNLSSGQLNSLTGAYINSFPDLSNSLENNCTSHLLSFSNNLLSAHESQTNNIGVSNNLYAPYLNSTFIRESSLTNDLSSFHDALDDKNECDDSPSSSIEGLESVESKNSKKLQVHDALLYLDDVRRKFNGTDVYNHFLTVMRLFKGQLIDTPAVIKKVADLFKGYPYLVVGFNAFLPTGYQVKLIDNELYAEEPSGKKWPVYNDDVPVGTALKTATEIVKQNALSSQVLSLLAKDPSIINSLNNPSLVLGNNLETLPQITLINQNSQVSYSPDISSSQRITNLEKTDDNMSKPMTKALLFISKIRAFYLDEDATYNKFLNILQAYQEIQNLGNTELIEEIFKSIAQLFAANKDLIKEFSDFIPDIHISQKYLYLKIAKEVIESTKEDDNKFASLVPNDDFLNNENLRRKKKRRKGRSYTGLCADPLPSDNNSEDNDLDDYMNDFDSENEMDGDNEINGDNILTDSINFNNCETNNICENIKDDDDSSGEKIIEKEDIQEITAENSTINKKLDPGEVLKLLERKEHMTKEESDECIFFGNLARQVRLPSEAVTIHNQLKLLDTISGAITYADDVPYHKKVEHIFRNYPKFKSSWLEMRNRADPYRMVPERVRGPKKAFFQSLKNIGRSYRLLPADYPRPLCSGRTAFEQQFLNDDYVAFPLWLSDEKRGEGICHKKSPTEELYIKLEEERFEYDMAILVTQAGLDVLEAFWDKLQNYNHKNKNKLIIDKRFGGTSDTLIERSMHRIYNHHTKFMISCMIEKPHLFLKNVMERMKQFIEDLTIQKHSCNVLWREKSDNLFYKAQDYQGNVQRQFDCKLLKGKTLVNQVVERNKALIKKQQHGDLTIKRTEFLQILPYTTQTFKEASELILHYVRKHLYMSKKEKIVVVQIVSELLPELLCYDPMTYDIDDYEGPILDPLDDNNENIENIEIDKKDMFVYLWDKSKNKKSEKSEEINSNAYYEINESGKRKRSDSPDNDEPASKVSKRDETSELLEEIKLKHPKRSPQNYIPNHSSIEYRTIFCNDAWIMFIRHFAIICDRLNSLKRKQDQLVEMYNDEEKEREKRKRRDSNNINSQVSEHLEMFDTPYHESALHPDKGHPSTFYTKVYEKLLLFVSGNMKQDQFEDFVRNIFTTTSHVLYSLDKFVQVAAKNCINAIGCEPDEENIATLYYRMSKAINAKTKFFDNMELDEQIDYQMAAEELIQRSKIFKLDFVKDTFNQGVSIYYRFIKQASLSDSDDEDDEENSMDIVWREFMDSLETEKLTKTMKNIIKERQNILPRNLKKKASKTNLTREELNRLPFIHKEPEDKDLWFEGHIRALEKPSDKFYISYVIGSSDLLVRKGYSEKAQKVTCMTDSVRKRKFDNWLNKKRSDLGMTEDSNDFDVFTENTNVVEVLHSKYHKIKLNRYVTELFSTITDLPLPEFDLVDENDIEDEGMEDEDEETEEDDTDTEFLEDEQFNDDQEEVDAYDNNTNVEVNEEIDYEQESENEDNDEDEEDEVDDEEEEEDDNDDLNTREIESTYEYEGITYTLQRGTDENGEETLYYTYDSQSLNSYGNNHSIDNYQYNTEEQQNQYNIDDINNEEECYQEDDSDVDSENSHNESEDLESVTEDKEIEKLEDINDVDEKDNLSNDEFDETNYKEEVDPLSIETVNNDEVNCTENISDLVDTKITNEK